MDGGEVGRQEARAFNCIRYFLSRLDYPGKDARVAHAADPLLVGEPHSMDAEDSDALLRI